MRWSPACTILSRISAISFSSSFLLYPSLCNSSSHMIPRGLLRIPRIYPPSPAKLPTLSSQINKARNLSSNSLPNLSARSPIAKRARLEDSSRMASTSSTPQVSVTNASFEHGDFGDYKLISSFDIKYAPIRIGKWKSERTGLSVVVGSHEGE